MAEKDVIIIIPAYRPDAKLVALAKELAAAGYGGIVVVDDGSGENSRAVFDAVRPLVDAILVHEVNRGKGAALKTAFAFIRCRYPEAAAAVTVDADGQHRPADILAVARTAVRHPGALTVGVRAFSGRVPLRSRFGNAWSRWTFFLLTRIWISDTQTGLRGIPAKFFRRMLCIPGSRYEYEMRMLADARNYDEEPVEVPIETVYLEGNASSHFHPVRDALRTQWALVMFCVSSVLAFAIDNGLFALAMAVMDRRGGSRGLEVAAALAISRFVSANFNYFYNRFFVFHSGRQGSFLRYWGLVAAIAALSCAGTELAASLFNVNGSWVTFLKIAVDTLLFVLSYVVQKRWIFKNRQEVCNGS